jgi:hypothetical protein
VRPVWIAVSASLVTLGVAGCMLRYSERPIATGGLTYHLTDLNPSSVPYKSGELVMHSHAIPVEVLTRKNGDLVEFSLVNSEVPIETETYKLKDQQFSLVAFGNDRFVPELPILRFPLQNADEWTWEGTFGPAENPVKATGKILADFEPLNIEGASSEDAVNVKVVLKYRTEGGASEKAERKILFWFTRDGFVKRQLHYGSTRQP